MRLARYRDGDQVHWGEVDGLASTVRPIARDFGDWAPEVIADGPTSVQFAADPVPLAAVTLLAPIEPTTEIAGVDMTYPENAPPPGSDIPFYTRPLAAIIGPEDEILFPELIRVQPQCQFGYEIELVAVLGRDVADPTRAIDDVLGYTIGNDGTLRWTRPSFVAHDLFGAKAAKSSAAIGPWIVTRDELGDAPGLELTLRINGVVRQSGHTGNLVRSIATLLEEVAWRLQLRTGDVVFSGTCGFIDDTGREESAGYYIAGDTVEAKIEGIGTLRNAVEATDPYPIHVLCRWAGERAVPGIRRTHPTTEEVAG